MKHYYLKFFLLLFIFLQMAVFSAGSASALATPALKWDQASCEAAHGEWNIPDQKCYAPKPVVKLAVPIPVNGSLFGAQAQAMDYADYISVAYRYAIAVAGVLAVVMIIIAGIMWLTAGGNQTRITKAKEYLSSALIGLVLLLGSYLLLNTINPSLVRIKNPGAEMVRSQSFASTFCSGVQQNQKRTIQLASTKDSQNKDIQYSSLTQGSFSVGCSGPNKCGDCNKKYFAQEIPGSSCYGDTCDNNKGCVDLGGEKFECKDAFISGSINWTEGRFVDHIYLVYACKDGVNNDVWDKDTNEKDKTFFIPLSIKDKPVCNGNQDQFLGYYLYLDVMDSYAANDKFILNAANCNSSIPEKTFAKGIVGSDTVTDWSALAGQMFPATTSNRRCNIDIGANFPND